MEVLVKNQIFDDQAKKRQVIKSGGIMETKTFNIPNISCGHCVMTIKNELQDLAGVKRVEGDPETKTITVEWEAPAGQQKILDLLKEINYPADS